MTRPSMPAALLLALGLVGCDAGPPDAGALDAALDARSARDAARSDTGDTGPVDAFAPGAPDAVCAQTEPDPDRTLQCSPCEPQCFVARDQPRAGTPAGPDLEYDADRGGARLAQGPGGLFVTEARHERVFDGTASCDPITSLSTWRRIDYQVELPAGTGIDFELRLANSEAALATAPAAVVAARDGVGEIDVTSALLLTGGPTSGPYFSVTVVFHASADGMSSPVLHHYDLRFGCLPGM